MHNLLLLFYQKPAEQFPLECGESPATERQRLMNIDSSAAATGLSSTVFFFPPRTICAKKEESLNTLHPFNHRKRLCTVSGVLTQGGIIDLI